MKYTHQAGFVGVVLSLLIVAALLGAGYWYAQNTEVAPSPELPTVGSSTSTPSPEPVGAGSSLATTTAIQVFYIALEDNGVQGKKIGCGDSVVGVPKTIPRTDAPLRAALTALLSDRRSTIGESGLVNVLANSNLSLDSVAINNGKATVRLLGSYTLGGVCDEPRFKAQLEETALQFPTVSSVEIFINGKTLASALSSQGE